MAAIVATNAKLTEHIGLLKTKLEQKELHYKAIQVRRQNSFYKKEELVKALADNDKQIAELRNAIKSHEERDLIVFETSDVPHTLPSTSRGSGTSEMFNLSNISSESNITPQQEEILLRSPGEPSPRRQIDFFSNGTPFKQQVIIFSFKF